MVVGPTSNMRYLLGYVPHPDERPCLLLLTPDRESFLVPEVNAADARQRVRLEMATYADEDGPGAATDAALGGLGATSPTTVALDNTMRTDFALLVLERTGGPSVVPTEGILGALRMVKDAAEIAWLRANAASADEALRAVFDFVRPGVSEVEIASVAREAFRRSGSLTVDFTIIGGGPNGTFPHHDSGGRRLATGDAVVIDIGAGQAGYHSDITRMAIVGGGPEGFREVHEIVERAVTSALASARPGARASEVDAAARHVIAAAGYGEFFPHRTGHGLGLDAHEPPYLTRTDETVLEVGMVFSIEPGIYLPGRFGVRLEEIVVLQKDGPAVLSRLGRAPYVVPG